MNILMVTNTYLPIVGGLELSIASFTEEYRKRGHRVIILAPEFDHSPPKECDVIRVPAFKNFNGSKYSIKFPIPVFFSKALRGFKADVIHTHHPFLMGDTALRLAYAQNAPLVFTHHSLYEENIHWMPLASGYLKKFMITLTTGYANLCDTVIAPTDSVADMLRENGVLAPLAVIPTGLHLTQYMGTSQNFKKEVEVPDKAFVVGYVGRLAEEKNLPFLIRAVALFLKKEKNALFLVVGSGPMKDVITRYFSDQALEKQWRFAGEMKGKKLIEAYQAIDVFAFASQSETQGMVLNEAMAAGTPVVAVDAPGARDIVVDKINGRLVPNEQEEAFASALSWVFEQSPEERTKLIQGAKETAKNYSVEKSATKALAVFKSLKSKNRRFKWLQHLNAEWNLFYNFTRAAAGAFR